MVLITNSQRNWRSENEEKRPREAAAGAAAYFSIGRCCFGFVVFAGVQPQRQASEPPQLAGSLGRTSPRPVAQFPQPGRRVSRPGRLVDQFVSQQLQVDHLLGVEATAAVFERRDHAVPVAAGTNRLGSLGQDLGIGCRRVLPVGLDPLAAPGGRNDKHQRSQVGASQPAGL